MAEAKKRPERMCVACREMKDKRQLIRIVRTPEGVVMVDPTGKMSGRGAYICPNELCFKRAAKSHALDKVLKTKIPQNLLQELQDKHHGN